ncbi:hypothetical protein K469DRAFT_643934, partial [Zopfia rhizophila CBS 207.26]
MDATVYLQKQGWRGEGHSLDHCGRGIKKPLLIAHKRDQLGLGKKKAAHNVSDQWWMRAFDESLKTFGTGQESALSQVRKSGINRGGLYGFFVKGEGLVGTISNTEESSAAEASNSNTSTPPSRASTPPTSPSEPSDTEHSDTEYPSKKEKRERKEAALAEKAGLSLEDYKAKIAFEKAVQNSKAVVAAKISKLTAEQKDQYAERARLKNQTFEEYVLRRISKKEEKRAEKK